MVSVMTILVKLERPAETQRGSRAVVLGWDAMRRPPGRLVDVRVGTEPDELLVRVNVPHGEEDRGDVLDAMEEVLNEDRGVAFSTLAVVEVRPL